MEILSSPARPAKIPSSPVDRVQQVIAQNRPSEVRDLIDSLASSASLETEKPLELAENLLRALENNSEPALTYPLTRILRLHLDLSLFKHFSHRQVLPQGMDERLKGLTIPSTEVALKHELQCALKACHLLSSPVEGFWGEYGLKLVEVVDALVKEQAAPSFSELSHLRRRVSNRYADVLFVFWIGRTGGPIEETQARIAQRKRDREVALCSVGVLAKYAWEGNGDALSLLCDLGGKGSKGAAHWPIRLSAIQLIQALQSAPDPQIAEASKTYLIERDSEESHPHVREAILRPPPVWNSNLGLLEFTVQPVLRHDEDLLQEIASQNRLEDNRLIAFTKEHPHISSLNLSPYQGITPEGLNEALQQCTQLDALILQGHPQIKLRAVPTTVKHLNLGGSPLTDHEVVSLVRGLPQLEELTLDDCPNITGKGFEALQVKHLSMNNTGVTASHLKPIIEAGIVRQLKVDNCSKLDLSFLEGGSGLTRLSLRGHLLNGVSLASHSHLISLDLAGANEVTDRLVATLPPSITSLSLRGSLVTAQGIQTLLTCTPDLRELHLEGSQVKGEDLDAEGQFPNLQILSLDGAEGCEEIVSRCPNLQQLSLFKANKLKSRVLIKMVKKRSSLAHLSVEGCAALDVLFVRGLIKECPNLTELEVGNAFGKITELELGGTPFGDDHVDLLLRHSPALKELDLSGCKNLTGKGLKRLVQACPKLKELDVEGCTGITPDDILGLSGLESLTYPLLASLLKAFPKIGQLDLSGCSRLDDEEIARAIHKGRLVHTMDLSDCRLGRASFKAFKEAGALESLSLQNCGTLNASDLRNLAQNPNLRYLNLRGCGEVTRTSSLNLEGCSLLGDPLLCTFTANLPKLEALVLKNCSTVSAEGIARAIQSCPDLHTLDLRECPQIEKEALRALFEAVDSLEKIFYGKKTVTRSSAPKPSRWPSEDSAALPKDLPRHLAGIYKSYCERHLGASEQARELQRELRCYIPLSAAEEGGDPRPLSEVLGEFLKDAARPCLLLTGDSGAGKSLSLRSLEAQTWCGGESNSNNSSSHPISTHFPLFIDLKGVRGREEDLPSFALKSMGYSEEQIQNLKTTTSFLFLLDGYDELGAWQQTPLEELLSGWQGKSIVTCRTQYLDRSPDYWEDWFAMGGSSKNEYTIHPFDQPQIEHYLDRFVQEGTPWTKERYLEAIATMPGLKNLVTSPLLLRLVIEALPKLPKDQQEVSRSDIYEKFIESWFERAKKRIRGRQRIKIPTLDQIYDFSGKLAHKMVQLGEFEAYSDTDEWGPFFSPEMEEALELAPLRFLGEGAYQFFHKSLIEFFAGQHLFRGLFMDKDRNNRTLQHRHTQQVLKCLEGHPLNEKRSPEGLEGVGQEALLVAEPAVVDFLVDRISRVPHREERLLQIVLASRSRPEVAIAAANAITILTRGGYSFAGLDLSRIQVANAALDGALMHYTNLTGACLRGVTLTRAQIVGADLKGADLREVSFGQWPMLKANGEVNCAAYSPDGSRVGLALDNGTVEIWDPIKTQRLMVLRAHEGTVESIAFSPDGKQAFTASNDRTARLWDLSSGQCLLTLDGHRWAVRSAAFSPDRKRALTVGMDKARLWDLASGKNLLTFKGKEFGAFSPDGKRAITSSGRATTLLWDLDSGNVLLTLEESGDFGAFSPDGKRALTSNLYSDARLWDLATGKELLSLKGHDEGVLSAAFSPDGKMALTASKDKTARLWDLDSGKNLGTLDGHRGALRSAAFSPDGKVALTASEDKTARLWDLAKGRVLLALQGRTPMVFSAALSPDGKVAVTASSDNTARLWDLSSGKLRLHLQGHTNFVLSAALSPDGKVALTASRDKTARIWDLATGKALLTLDGHNGWVQGAVFSPDGKAALTASRDKTACLWDLASGKKLLTLEGHSGPVNSAAFSPDGKVALTSCGKTARVWDLASGKELLILNGHSTMVFSAAFSPDGHVALTGSRDKTARLWEVTTGKCLLTLKGHSSLVNSVAFSPDGRAALTASDDTTARLWDSASGQSLQVLYGHTGPVRSAKWGTQDEIITASADKTVALWRRVSTAQGSCFCVVWLSGPTDLVAEGCLIEGAKMSNQNAVLLEQKGGEGSAVTDESNSNN